MSWLTALISPGTPISTRHILVSFFSSSTQTSYHEHQHPGKLSFFTKHGWTFPFSALTNWKDFAGSHHHPQYPHPYLMAVSTFNFALWFHISVFSLKDQRGWWYITLLLEALYFDHFLKHRQISNKQVWISILLGYTKLLCVLVAQSCLTLCDSMDCSPPGSFVHVILQARILGWVAISFSKNCYNLSH